MKGVTKVDLLSFWGIFTAIFEGIHVKYVMFVKCVGFLKVSSVSKVPEFRSQDSESGERKTYKP